MILIKILLIGTIALIVAVFINDYLYPFLKGKITWWLWSRKIRRMAKKYDGETKEDLLKVADALMEISKSHKLSEPQDDEEDDY